MNKQELVKYFKTIWPYLNLSELCKAYNNANPHNSIDYNNLRSTINGNAPNRLSEEKLLTFYNFLTKEIFQKTFKITANNVSALEITGIVKRKTQEMLSQITEELNNGFSNK